MAESNSLFKNLGEATLVFGNVDLMARLEAGKSPQEDKESVSADPS